MKRNIQYKSFIEINLNYKIALVLSSGLALLLSATAGAQTSNCVLDEATGNVSCTPLAQAAEGPQEEAPPAGAPVPPGIQGVPRSRAAVSPALASTGSGLGLGLGLHNLSQVAQVNPEFQITGFTQGRNGRAQLSLGVGNAFSASASGSVRVPFHCSNAPVARCFMAFAQGNGQTAFRDVDQRSIAAAAGIGGGVQTQDGVFAAGAGAGLAVRAMDSSTVYFDVAPALLLSLRASPHPLFEVRFDGSVIFSPTGSGAGIVRPGFSGTLDVLSHFNNVVGAGVRFQATTGEYSRISDEDATPRTAAGAHVMAQGLVNVNFEGIGGHAAH